MDNQSTIHVKIITGRADVPIIREQQDYIIAVDSGIGVLRKANLLPDCLVGDLDSANQEDVAWAREYAIEIHTFPANKDQVDTELALELAYKLNPKRITIYNDMYGRVDHAMALLYLLLHPLKRNIECSIVSLQHNVYLINKSITLNFSNAAYISILPFLTDAKATATGLKYDLPETLEIMRPVGISNEFVKEVSEITVNQGIILLIVSKIV